MDRAAAQEAFSGFLSDRSLTPPQIRFIEMVIDQLVARGVMEASALYEPPFSNLHAGGPDELFVGQENVIEGIFDRLNRSSSLKRSSHWRSATTMPARHSGCGVWSNATVWKTVERG